MAQAGDEWELSKENVQPLRQGRAMSTLQEVLSQQDCSHHTIQQQKQAFELELRFYTGDDPLDVWDRYIKWAQQAFPQGGKESNLSSLLERAVKIFHMDKRYYNDIRYLNICLKFAHFCTEPVDLYSYLYSQGIGIQHAHLYITWAEEYEARGNYKKADAIFQDGVQHQAEPLEKLEAHHKQFQARVSRQVLQGISDGEDIQNSESSQPQRCSLADLKTRGKNKARAPVTRVGDFIKPCNQSYSAPQQQITREARFSVFDENASHSVAGCQVPLAVQPWAALPSSSFKENEKKAGPWNSGRPLRGDNQTSNIDLSSNRPSFIPYVDDLTEQQTVTPCKINPSITSVLSARKSGKDDDPLLRLQNVSQGKEEMVMYCKNKIYAGVEEFSFEEIRAELHMEKLRKKNEEYLLASAFRRQTMERQIEEMEKKLKELSRENQEHNTVEPVQVESNVKPKSMDHHSHCEPDAVSNMGSLVNEDAMETVTDNQDYKLQSIKGLSLAQHMPQLTELNPSTMLSVEAFTIYDESFDKQLNISSQNLGRMPPPTRWPFSAVSKQLNHEDVSTPPDTLDGIEPLNEETIVFGSDKNKTLSADPEDTCDFVRAANLASTPFQKVRDETQECNLSSLERLPLRERAPEYEESFNQVVYPKKLSPILEASREDMPVLEKTDFATQMLEVYEETLESSLVLCERTELKRNLLAPMSDLLISEQIHQEARLMPPLKKQTEVQLVTGSEKYKLKSEIVLGKSSKILTGSLTDMGEENLNGVVMKVDSVPVPWDFYITQQLKKRLSDGFENYFLIPSDCFIFQNGCITLYNDINCFSVQDILKDPGTVVEDVVILLAYNLLSLTEKLHSADIIHGDLRTETLLLDNRIFSLPPCTEMNCFIKPTDFSHSMDLRLCPKVTLQAFPISQTEYGQQLLGNQASPYQVDLLGIANLVHFMIFGKSLQIHQEDSTWKIKREIPRFWRTDLWKNFFSKILNPNKESQGNVLKKLKDEMLQLFDSRFQDDLCCYFIHLENQLNL